MPYNGRTVDSGSPDDAEIQPAAAARGAVLRQASALDATGGLGGRNVGVGRLASGWDLLRLTGRITAMLRRQEGVLRQCTTNETPGWPADKTLLASRYRKRQRGGPLGPQIQQPSRLGSALMTTNLDIERAHEHTNPEHRIHRRITVRPRLASSRLSICPIYVLEMLASKAPRPAASAAHPADGWQFPHESSIVACRILVRT
ncbi:uncharacterized protein BDZ99DRAFT_515017 [Mytilinidion resinicola]|uniref:Uncharacterized protein n=1 Tax=Mytilinidion resinicola TaxID=574789 RepID=A0A6A6Z6I7_9PEZI|nr:uncharacterized protein BDZ99DRAFT_515017 [Mytilinidion resinicola]KAF2816428.1 hypothetical protein BDZ99DRAFT_515017 [Mytilinidion resinicola]